MKNSRQYRWQQAHIKQGLCRNCGEPLLPGSKNYCEYHLQRNREYKRKKLGLNPWVSGGPGRPPLEETR